MGRALNSPGSAARLAEACGMRLVGDDHPLTGVQAIEAATAGHLSFAKGPAYLDRVPQGSVLIIPDDEDCIARAIAAGASALISANPRLHFAKALDLLEKEVGFSWSRQQPEIHPTAIVGQNVVLGEGVRIGAGAVIMHNVVIGREVIIGDGCIVKSCAVIGEDGFGFERADDGRAQRLPHIGSVVIEDGVEIGSLTTVCRGTLGDTIIRRGAKIDDHVHIAHNVDVGEDAFVIACAEVSGGVRIGRQAWIAPNASIKNQVRIGAKSIVGLGAVVIKEVDDGAVVAGNPAKPLNVG